MSMYLFLSVFSILLSIPHAQLECDGVEYSVNGRDSLILPTEACITSIATDLSMQSAMYTCNSTDDLIYHNYTNSNCSGSPEYTDSAVTTLGLTNSGDKYYKIVCGQKQCDYAIARKYRTDKGCPNITTNNTDPNALYEDTIYTLLGDGACFAESAWSYGYTVCTEGVSIGRSYFGQNEFCRGDEVKEEILENECGVTDDGQYGTILHIKCGIFTTTASPTAAPVDHGSTEQEDTETPIVIAVVVAVLLIIGAWMFYACYWSRRPKKEALSCSVGGRTYEFGEIMGEGRTCRVVEGIDHDNNAKKVAVKIMSKRKPISQTLYKREVDILSRIEHRNIVKYIDGTQDNTNYYIITGIYGGGDLFERVINSEYEMTEKIAAALLSDMLSAIKYLHEKDIVHRDLKPENFIFSNNNNYENIMLIDFGSAKIVNDDEKYDKEVNKILVGSVHYMAPELVEGNRKIHKTGKVLKCSDVWSIGITAYVMLTGRYPFKGKTDKDTFDRIINGKLTFPSDVFLSDGFKDFIRKMLLKNPDERVTIDEAICDPWIQRTKTV